MFMKNQSNRCAEQGFSLITIAIALAIISLMMIPAIQMFNLSQEAEKRSRNTTSTTLASSALNKYFLLFGHYPYPATPGNAMGTSDFGHVAIKPSTDWPDCQLASTPDNVVCRTTLNTVGGGAVLIGVVPFAELNIPFTSVLDGNKNLLTYAVTEDLTLNATYSESGGKIIVTDITDTPIYPSGAKSHFVVAGHGDDARGAYGVNGVRNLPCGDDSDSNDFENCNKDGKFRSNSIGENLVQINDGLGIDHFDDYVQERNSSVAGIWSFVPNPLVPDLSISDRVGGNVATGNCDGNTPCTPVSRFDIYGDGTAKIPAVRATSVRTTRFCGRGNSSGDTVGSAAWNCVNDYGLASNIFGTDPLITTCVSGDCPPSTTTWSKDNLPPWFTPQLIAGTPVELPESGSYWNTTAPGHGQFHRGNGILCVGGRGINGIFDYDEACNTSTYITPASQGILKGCPAGQYARGLLATNDFKCQNSVDNK